MPKGRQSRSGTASRNKTNKKRKPLGEIAGVIFIALGIFLGVCVFIESDTGILGGVLKGVFFGLFGIFAYLAPFVLIVAGVMTIIARNKKVNKGKVALVALLLVSIFSLVHTLYLQQVNMADGFFKYVESSYLLGRDAVGGSGAVGCLLVYPLHLLIGTVGCIIMFITLILVPVLVLTNLSLKKMGRGVAGASKKAAQKAREGAQEIREVREARRKNRLFIEDLAEDELEEIEEEIPQPEILGRRSFRRRKHASYFDDDEYADDDVRARADTLPGPEDVAVDEPVYDQGEPGAPTFETYKEYDPSRDGAAVQDDEPHVVKRGHSHIKYKKPPISLLAKPAEKSKAAGMEEQRQNAQLIEETLANFGVEAKVVHIVKGPAVTRYELRPAPGVRVRRIKELENDLAMNLAAKSVKIEAPIPGKAAVGVEVPNSDISFVHLRTLLATEEFRKATSPLTFALGKDISGKNYFVDIAKMPHMLIAGETGSGKSVCINSMILSIMFKATPDEVKMILIDPKVVELSVFKTIPHLLVPVVTDPKKAAGALHWAVSEMTSRYKLFAERGARNINRYNELADGNEDEKLPRIVVIIDELAELMMSAPREVEETICRIAQLGRAAGIHLIVATQRPSVNVITGLIKANISSRIAFKVNAGVDSRTIIDKNGAEKLLRNGDMLYHPAGAPKETRLQGCFVSDDDIEVVTEYVSQGQEAEYNEEVLMGIKGTDEGAKTGDDYDELLPQAIEIVLEYGQASISMLQRRLRVGYARAARLVDEMEQRKIVSPFEGSKARQVLITRDVYEQMFGPSGD